MTQTTEATEKKKEDILDLVHGTTDASEADERFLDGENGQPGSVEDVLEDGGDPGGSDGTGGPPDWVVMPTGLKMPVGRQAVFVRFRAAWCDVPALGDRHCIMWNLTEADEKLALQRTRGDQMRAIDELTKQMIRAVDGQKADWGKGVLSNVNKFWSEVGGACRQQLKNVYVKNHTLDLAQATDFFTNCIAVRTVGT